MSPTSPTPADRVLVTEHHTVRRWDVLDTLNERMTCVDGTAVGDLVDELFGDAQEMPFGDFLEWVFALSAKTG